MADIFLQHLRFTRGAPLPPPSAPSLPSPNSITPAHAESPKQQRKYISGEVLPHPRVFSTCIFSPCLAPRPREKGWVLQTHNTWERYPSPPPVTAAAYIKSYCRLVTAGHFAYQIDGGSTSETLESVIAERPSPLLRPAPSPSQGRGPVLAVKHEPRFEQQPNSLPFLTTTAYTEKHHATTTKTSAEKTSFLHLSIFTPPHTDTHTLPRNTALGVAREAILPRTQFLTHRGHILRKICLEVNTQVGGDISQPRKTRGKRNTNMPPPALETHLYCSSKKIKSERTPFQFNI